METILENLLLITLLVDFGLVVLIWMVQLLVYPSFLYYKKENLMIWHQKYTKKIAVIVIPLMLMQLTIALLNVYLYLNITHITSLVVVLFLWGFTFTSFAPLHFKISDDKSNQKLLQLLVKRNWVRTVVWTLLFVFHFFFL